MSIMKNISLSKREKEEELKWKRIRNFQLILNKRQPQFMSIEINVYYPGSEPRHSTIGENDKGRRNLFYLDPKFKRFLLG
mgnify:CR=1 FL=1